MNAIETLTQKAQDFNSKSKMTLKGCLSAEMTISTRLEKVTGLFRSKSAAQNAMKMWDILRIAGSGTMAANWEGKNVRVEIIF